MRYSLIPKFGSQPGVCVISFQFIQTFDQNFVLFAENRYLQTLSDQRTRRFRRRLIECYKIGRFLHAKPCPSCQSSFTVSNKLYLGPHILLRLIFINLLHPRNETRHFLTANTVDLSHTLI